jgi:hypothetical protein
MVHDPVVVRFPYRLEPSRLAGKENSMQPETTVCSSSHCYQRATVGTVVWRGVVVPDLAPFCADCTRRYEARHRHKLVTA